MRTYFTKNIAFEMLWEMAKFIKKQKNKNTSSNW